MKQLNQLKQWKIISSKEENRELETETCIVGIISDRKKTSTILKTIPDLPPRFNHIKRVRNYQNQLEILISEIEQENISEKFIQWKENEMNRKMFESIEGIDFNSLKLVEIAKYPPVTKEQYKIYSQLWPCNLVPPTYPTPSLTQNDIVFVNEQFTQLMKWKESNKLMENSSEKEYQILNGECDKRNITLICNVQHEIVSIQQDETEKLHHPLLHSCYHCLKSIPLEKKQYLCTGFDVFLLYEPCLFCGMSLLHSRIGRVFFLYPNETNGAFTVHAIHKNRYLNHHFNVYQCEY